MRLLTKPLLLFFLLACFSASRGQHPALDNSRSSVQEIKRQSPDAANDPLFLRAFARYIFLLSHFRDTTVIPELQFLDSLTKKSALPVARGFWLLSESYYLHTVKKQYKQSLNNNLEAITLFEKNGFFADAALCHARASGTLMWFSATQKNNEQTLKEGISHARMSVLLGKQANDTNIICTGLMYGANNFLVQGQNDSAKKLLYEAKTMALKKNLHYPIDNNIWGTLAELYTGLGQTDSALFFAENCLKTGKAQNDLYSLSSIYRLKGELLTKYSKEKNYQQGINFLDTAMVYANQLKDISVLALTEQSLFTAHKANGNEKKALFYLEQLTLHREELRKQNENSFKAEYELAQKEKQIGQLENEKLVSNSKKQRLLIWLLALGGVIIALTAIFFARNNYMLNQKKREIEAAMKKGQHIERKRMAADLHDNLGVQASAILHSTSVLKNSPGEAGTMADNLHDTAKEMLLNLRETLWAMKNNEVAAPELWIRVINFVKQLNNHYKTSNFTLTGFAPKDLIMDSPGALHALMIIQEAVNNAAKHAQASEINIASEFDDKLWVISVGDNGKGFDAEAAKQKKECYGLTNMSERAKAANATIDIKSAPGNGTTMSLHIPL